MQISVIEVRDYPELEQTKVTLVYPWNDEKENCRIAGCCDTVGITIVDEYDDELVCLNHRVLEVNEFVLSGANVDEVFQMFIKMISEGLVDYNVLDDYFGVERSMFGGQAPCAFT
jgi:hypothetical protein